MGTTTGRGESLIYLLSLMGVQQDEIVKEISKVYGYSPEPRNVFTCSKKDPDGGTKKKPNSFTDMLISTVDGDMIKETMAWLGLTKAIEQAESEMNLKGDKKGRLEAIVDKYIDLLTEDPKPAFLHFIFLIYMYNQRISTKHVLGDVKVPREYFKINYGLDITSLMPTVSALALSSDNMNTKGMPITILHTPQRWRARYMGFSERILETGLQDVGILINAVAVYEFIKKKNMSDGTTVWNGQQTRVCSCSRDQGEYGSVILNTCETDYVSHLATNYGLLRGSNYYRMLLGTPDNLASVHRDFQAVTKEKTILIQKDTDMSAYVTEVDLDLYKMRDWDKNRLEQAISSIDNIAATEHKISIFEISKSVLANCMSVNIVYRHHNQLYIQQRGLTGHGRVKYQISAAGFVELPYCCTELPNDRTPDIMKAIDKESKEELLKKRSSVVIGSTMEIMGIVRDNINCEVGVLASAVITPEKRQEDVLGDVTEFGAEVADYNVIMDDPISMYNFVLRESSYRTERFEPWSDMMPLGAATLLFSMIRKYGDDSVKKAFRQVLKQMEKEEGKKLYELD